MTKNDLLNFEIYVMDLADECKTKEDFENLSRHLHESVELAIEDVCSDAGIDDYDPYF